MASPLFDRVVAHQIGFERAKAGEVKVTRELLSVLDDEILTIINKLPDNYTKRQLDRALLLIDIKTQNFYERQVLKSMEKIGRDTVKIETEFASTTVDKFLNPEKAKIKRPSNLNVFRTGQKTKYEGKLLSEWTGLLGKDKSNRIRKNIIIGAVDSEKPSKLAIRAKQSIRTANKNSDTITKTYVNQFSNVSRDEVYNANPDNVIEIIWSTILDSGTTVTCGVRSNKRYDAKTKDPIDHDNDWGGGPGVIHFGCRSVPIPTDAGGLIASGPAKGEKFDEGTKTAIGGNENYERGDNENRAGGRAKIPSKHNELEKQLVKGKVDYESWMRTQPRAFVEDSLGVGKAREFLDNNKPLKEFVVSDGTELTLAQLM